MIKREFKTNFKSFLIWVGILVGLFLFVFLLYPYFITADTIKSIDEMMESLPPELLKAFNMDIASISTAYGWLKTEGFMFVLLIVGFYASLLGSNILLKEESDKTIEYLGVLPITRNRILTNKVIVSITYMVLLVVIFGIFNYIALSFSGEFDHKQFIMLSITPIFIALPFYALNLFISTFLRKTKKTVGISLGLVFIFYLLSVMSELSNKSEFLKYFSLYTLADVRNVISNVELNPVCITVSFIFTIVFISLSYIRYNKKELV